MAVKKHVQHIRSSVPNTPPTANSISYGEIAINYAAGTETIYIKNSNNNIIPFVNKNEVAKMIMEPILWSDLVTKKRNSELVPGAFYRITDYNTETSAGTETAGHQFDIIVMALTNSELSENASATLHDGDTYFSDYGANLNAWELKYCINNDSDRFNWAPVKIGGGPIVGRGVIYYMKDEHGNEAPYDFKNIMFKRPMTNGVYDPENGIDTYTYTFTWVNDSDEITDASVTAQLMPDGTYVESAEEIVGVKNNRIDRMIDSLGRLSLNDNVFISSYSTYSQGEFYGIEGNTFGVNCGYNTFADYCNNNTFGNRCQNNTFAKMTNHCTFGNDVNNVNVQCGHVNHLHVEGGNEYINLTTTATVSDSDILRNITIAQGVNNTSTVKTISHNTLNDTFKTTYAPANSVTVTA